mmetsp:Transcript_26863/g.65328  ORF Transcript_26863/g.65328 Transcript_26863/m.65328 type:complete len:370 (+) Transcript_26863:68-1177(+)
MLKRDYVRGVFTLGIVTVLISLFATARFRAWVARTAPTRSFTPPFSTTHASEWLGTDQPCRWAKYQSLVNPLQLYQSWGYTNIPNKIYYAKVHKTGSSAVTATLRMFARRYDLVNVGRPVETKSGLDAELERQGKDRVDILSGHFQYNRTVLDPYLGRRPFRIASVRDPTDRMLSAYWYAVERANSGEEGAGAFVCSGMVGTYERWVTRCNRLISQLRYMAPRDWPEEYAEDVSRVFNHYDHVLVTEKMTESMLTLAPKVGLTLADLIMPQKKLNSQSQNPFWLTPYENADLETRIAKKVAFDPGAQLDRQLHALAEQSIDRQFDKLPDILKALRDDLAQLSDELREECNSRLGFDCKEEWLQKNVMCT